MTELHGGRLAFAARASLTRCHRVNADRRLISDRFDNLVRTSPGGPDPVCTENLNPDIMVMKSAENRV